MRKRNIENPLVDKMIRFSGSERIAAFAAIGLIVAGVSGAILSRITCKETKKPKSTPSLKVCTPEEQAKVKQTLQKGRQATGEEVNEVIGQLDAILDKKLDCGWEPVMDLRKKLSFRRQP
ncbi:hypothetical protein ACFL3T_03345 [Patescibacteria group bacterium]